MRLFHAEEEAEAEMRVSWEMTGLIVKRNDRSEWFPFSGFSGGDIGVWPLNELSLGPFHQPHHVPIHAPIRCWPILAADRLSLSLFLFLLSREEAVKIDPARLRSATMSRYFLKALRDQTCNLYIVPSQNCETFWTFKDQNITKTNIPHQIIILEIVNDGNSSLLMSWSTCELLLDKCLMIALPTANLHLWIWIFICLKDI